MNVGELIAEIEAARRRASLVRSHWRTDKSILAGGHIWFIENTKIVEDELVGGEVFLEYDTELALKVDDYLSFRWKLNIGDPESVSYEQYERHKIEKGEWK